MWVALKHQMKFVRLPIVSVFQIGDISYRVKLIEVINIKIIEIIVSILTIVTINKIEQCDNIP